MLRLLGTVAAGAALFAVQGCAVNSGIVPAGEGVLFVSRQAATGFAGLGNLKSDALKEAMAHCGAQGRGLEVLGVKESQPPYILSNFPRVEVTFRCNGGRQRPSGMLPAKDYLTQDGGR